MKAVQFNEYGGPDVLQIVDFERPQVGPGEVLIAVRAAGVNPADWKIRSGLMKEVFPRDFPAGVGFEASGIVDEVGAGVTNVAVGDAVFGAGRNTFAEFAVLSIWARKPDTMSFEQAAALTSNVLTATRILHAVGVKAGETLLVNGAAGGVGSAVLQFAREGGINVIGTATELKHDYLRSMGATAVTYGPRLIERVKKLAPDGVDAALDLVGSDVLPDLIALTGNASRVLATAGREASKYGALTTPPMQKNPEEALARAAEAFERGVFRIHIDRAFPLAETKEAQIASEAKHATGKLVVVVS